MPIIVPFVETFLGQMVLDLKFIVGLVFFIWSQNMPHGNKVLDDEDLALPILDTTASNWEANAKAMWRDYGVCAAKLDLTARDLKSLYATFQTEVSALEASGFGSCAKVGFSLEQDCHMGSLLVQFAHSLVGRFVVGEVPL